MKMETEFPDRVIELMRKGVNIPTPFSVEIGEEVDVDRISGSGVTLQSGTRIYGAKTLICSGTKLGYESPATIVDCQIGPEVELKGGFFKEAVFLEKANVASGAHVRECSILEEQSNGAHTVGLKQTILFPFVTLGSLINFCDCFMAGGTDRKNHSEVGSSYIHFNYTPNQDKATASLIGDVPRGVMLNQPPIFLGGQGGLVGPARIGYGTIIAAGTICREDCPEGNKLFTGSYDLSSEGEFEIGFYRSIKKKAYNNICYLANLLALRQWYIHVRRPFFQTDQFGPELYAGSLEKLNLSIKERLNRFRALSEKMERSIEIGDRKSSGTEWETLSEQKRDLLENWPKLEECFTGGYEEEIDLKNRDSFIDIIGDRSGAFEDYIKVIKGLDSENSSIGTAWLQAIVTDIIKRALQAIPSHK
jgi:bifunctional UDP-N-acetylglucosamine pyrophosphorylase/glucosamine-1-phosphate N-acetyltransferase